MSEFIPVFEPLLDGNEKKYLNECIDKGWIGSNGPFVKQLEHDFSAYCCQKYGSTVTNGTAALEVALQAMKDEYSWSDYDEIIVPSFNIISSAQACIYNKLKPVFVDCEDETWNIDVNKIEQVITPKTRGIIVVHIYGLPSDMYKILDLAKKYNLKIIEDAAQAHGMTYNGKKCGSFGDISTFSFYTNKHVASGEGGIVLSSDKNLIDKVNYYKNLCFTKDRFVHNHLGHNLRMSNLQAAVACAQLEKIEKTIAIKKHIGGLYQELLKNIPAKLSKAKMPYAENHYWVFGLVLNDDIKLNAKTAMEKLAQANIETRPFFYSLHLQRAVLNLGIKDNISRPVSEKIYEKGFYIPTGLTLTVEKIEYISNQIKALF